MSKSLWDSLFLEVNREILIALGKFRPSLKQTTGTLPIDRVPSNIPGSRLAAGSVTPTELSFDPATQTELDAHAADTTSVHGITDTSLLMVNPMTTIDDLIVGGTSGAPSRLAKGADGQVLTVDPTTHHLIWATPSGGGGGSSLTVEEVDGSPTDSAVTKIVFPNGTLGIASHVATYTPAIGGGWSQIGTETVLGSSTASFDFVSIPGTYGALQIRIIGHTDRSGQAIDALLLQFNGDTGANYDYTDFRGDSGATGTGLLGQTSMQVGYLPGNTAQSDAVGTFIIDIPYYAQTTFWKNVTSIGRDEEQSGTTSSTRSMLASGTWKSTSAITSIKLFNLANFISGSRASLYGLITN